MRILRVINSLDFGGAERSIATNVPLHIQNGFDMDVVVLNGRETFFLKDLIDKNVKIIKFGVNNNIYNPFLIFKFIKLLRQYDIIHAHLFPAFYWVAIAKMLTFSNTKLVFTEHSTSNRRRENWVFKIADKIIYSQYKIIIAISEATKVNLQKQINSSNKIRVIPNGVDINKLKTAPVNISPELREQLKDKKVIVQVAGFRKSKDQDTVIKAIKKLNENYCLVLVGDGERKRECQELAKLLEIEKRVFFVGIQNNIVPFLNASDVVIMSSHWEGFGRSAVEGMAMGKPVIATNVTGLADVVGSAGLLFDVGDVNRLTELIFDLTNDDLLYNQVSSRCHARANEYDIRFMIDEYEKVYTSII